MRSPVPLLAKFPLISYSPSFLLFLSLTLLMSYSLFSRCWGGMAAALAPSNSYLKLKRNWGLKRSRSASNSAVSGPPPGLQASWQGTSRLPWNSLLRKDTFNWNLNIDEQSWQSIIWNEYQSIESQTQIFCDIWHCPLGEVSAIGN